MLIFVGIASTFLLYHAWVGGWALLRWKRGTPGSELDLDSTRGCVVHKLGVSFCFLVSVGNSVHYLRVTDFQVGLLPTTSCGPQNL